MKSDAVLKGLLGGCAIAALLPNLVGLAAQAQEADDAPVTVSDDEEEDVATMNRVVVTGSRIMRDVASTPAPVAT